MPSRIKEKELYNFYIHERFLIFLSTLILSSILLVGRLWKLCLESQFITYMLVFVLFKVGKLSGICKIETAIAIVVKRYSFCEFSYPLHCLDSKMECEELTSTKWNKVNCKWAI